MIRGLSARLLILTIVFVMIAEILIYAPSISRYRKVYLEEMMAQAHLAALALEGSEESGIDPTTERELLTHAGAHAVILIRKERRMLALNEDMPPPVDVMIDLRAQGWTDWMGDAFDTLFQRSNRVLRVIGESPKDPGAVVEVIFDETPLREAMYSYSTRILQLSLLISFFTAGLLYLSLQWLLIRPCAGSPTTWSPSSRTPRTKRGSSCRAGGPTRSASPSGNWRSCSARCVPRWIRKGGWRPWARRWPRSTMTCATACPPRCWRPTG